MFSCFVFLKEHEKIVAQQANYKQKKNEGWWRLFFVSINVSY